MLVLRKSLSVILRLSGWLFQSIDLPVSVSQLVCPSVSLFLCLVVLLPISISQSVSVCLPPPSLLVSPPVSVCLSAFFCLSIGLPPCFFHAICIICSRMLHVVDGCDNRDARTSGNPMFRGPRVGNEEQAPAPEWPMGTKWSSPMPQLALGPSLDPLAQP